MWEKIAIFKSLLERHKSRQSLVKAALKAGVVIVKKEEPVLGESAKPKGETAEKEEEGETSTMEIE